MQIMVVSYTGW